MIEYRLANAADSSLLAEIRVEFLSDAHNGISDEEKPELLANNRQFMASAIADGSFAAWIALDNGKIIATSGVSFYCLPPNTFSKDGKTAYISNMFTYPQYRNKGIASKLFALTVEEAKKRGCARVSLHATDMGRPIYKKFGFEDTKDGMSYSLI